MNDALSIKLSEELGCSVVCDGDKLSSIKSDFPVIVDFKKLRLKGLTVYEAIECSTWQNCTFVLDDDNKWDIMKVMEKRVICASIDVTRISDVTDCVDLATLVSRFGGKLADEDAGRRAYCLLASNTVGDEDIVLEEKWDKLFAKTYLTLIVSIFAIIGDGEMFDQDRYKAKLWGTKYDNLSTKQDYLDAFEALPDNWGRLGTMQMVIDYFKAGGRSRRIFKCVEDFVNRNKKWALPELSQEDKALSSKLSLMLNAVVECRNSKIFCLRSKESVTIDAGAFGILGLDDESDIELEKGSLFLEVNDEVALSVADSLCHDNNDTFLYILDISGVKSLDICFKIYELFGANEAAWQILDTDAGRLKYCYLATGIDLFDGEGFEWGIEPEWDARFVSDFGDYIIAEVSSVVPSQIFSEREYEKWKIEAEKGLEHDEFYSDAITNLRACAEKIRSIVMLCDYCTFLGGVDERLISCERDLVKRFVKEYV